MEWFRLMTFCPCSLPVAKFVPPYHMGSSNFVTGISQGRMSSILTVLEKNDIHLNHSKVLRHHLTVMNFIFSNQEAEYH
jgi:hypothetical protein